MLISHSHKFIFVKTKKTAGSTVESVIVDNFFDKEKDLCTGSVIDGTPRIGVGTRGPGPDGHKPWNLIMDMVGIDTWSDYHTFTIERNPWEKVASHYFWKLSSRKSESMSFESFVEKLLYNGKAPVDWTLYANDSGLQVDQVIQYSELADSLVSLFNDKYNLPMTKDMVTGTRKKSGHRKKHYTEMYTSQRLIDKVSVLYLSLIHI